MSQRPLLCCPAPAVNPLQPHTVPNGSTNVPTTPGYACTNPLFVTNCGPAVAPVPISLQGEDCTGAPISVSGNPGELTAVVQAPGTVFSVKLCDTPKTIQNVTLCDPANGHQIVFQYDMSTVPPTQVSAFDMMTGLPWTGDPATLVVCPGAEQEAEPEIFCDGTNSFYRWLVVKGGKPTGVFWDTDFTGAPYTPLGLVNPGDCQTVCASIPLTDCGNTSNGYMYAAADAGKVGATVAIQDCDGVVYGYIFAASGPGHTTPVYEGCAPDPQVLIGYADDVGCATVVNTESDPVDVCVDGVSMTQWVVKQDGMPTGTVYYTDANGQLFTPATGAVVVLGSCPAAACDPTISSAPGDTLAGLLPGHSISIQKNNCCSIKVHTSAGDFIVSKDVTGYSTGDFNCLVTVTSVEILSGTCSLADVIVTTQSKG